MKDNAQLLAQVLLIVLGPLLPSRHILFSSDSANELAGAILTLVGAVWKFVHWHTTPSAPTENSAKTPTPNEQKNPPAQ